MGAYRVGAGARAGRGWPGGRVRGLRPVRGMAAAGVGESLIGAAIAQGRTDGTCEPGSQIPVQGIPDGLQESRIVVPVHKAFPVLPVNATFITYGAFCSVPLLMVCAT